MSLFSNPFFSIAGQVERLKNVGATLNAAFNPFSKNTVVANTSSSTVNKVLETVANHPYVAAAIASTAIAPQAALAAGKVVATTVGKAAVSFAKTNPKTAVLGLVSAPAIVTAVAQSPRLQHAIENAPSQSVEFGSGIAKLVEQPSMSNAINLFKGSPIISSALVAAGGLGLGYAGANLLSTLSNTSAVKANTKATALSAEGQPQAINIVNQLPQQSAEVAAPQTVAPSAAPKTKKKTKKKAKKKAKKKTRRSKKKAKKKRKTIKRNRRR